MFVLSGVRPFLGVVLLILFLLLQRVIPSFSASPCNATEILFMGRCFCETGWESSTQAGPSTVLNCTLPIRSIKGCKCERSLAAPTKFRADPDNLNCKNFCNSNSQLGIPRSIPEVWKQREYGKQLPFYSLEYRKGGSSHLKNRLLEFADGFSKWTYLNNTDFGDVIEFGAGPYTQLRNIMEHVNVKVSSVTLVEPLLNGYMEINGCSYHTGSLVVNGRSLPTSLSNLTAEQFGVTNSKQYDTVIIMNVAGYALNLFTLLQALYDATKPNGILIFHERYYLNYLQSSNCNAASFRGNYIIMPTKGLMDHFLSFYGREPYYSLNQTKEAVSRSKDWCRWLDDELSYWACVRKNKN